MATETNTIEAPLPREMMQHTYPLLTAGGVALVVSRRRRIIASFVKQICEQVTYHRPRILDGGAAPARTLKMLAEFGGVEAEGVEVSTDAPPVFVASADWTTSKLGAAEELPTRPGLSIW